MSALDLGHGFDADAVAGKQKKIVRGHGLTVLGYVNEGEIESRGVLAFGPAPGKRPRGKNGTLAQRVRCS